MNISRTKLLLLIKEYNTVPIELLNKYLSTQTNISFNLIINLFFDSNIIINSYDETKAYINNITELYFQLYPKYSFDERKWLRFFVMLKIIKTQFEYSQMLIEEYENLPEIISNDDFLVWVIGQVKNYIKPYYISLNTSG